MDHKATEQFSGKKDVVYRMLTDDLIIVKSDENDLSTPVTSQIWVTRKNTNVVRTF